MNAIIMFKSCQFQVQVLEKNTECGAQNAYEALLAKTVSPTRRSTKSNTGKAKNNEIVHV